MFILIHIYLCIYRLSTTLKSSANSQYDYNCFIQHLQLHPESAIFFCRAGEFVVCPALLPQDTGLVFYHVALHYSI